MVVTANGIVSRLKPGDISRQGRPATGVKIQNLMNNDQVCTVNKIANTDDETETTTEKVKETEEDNSSQGKLLE